LYYYTHGGRRAASSSTPARTCNRDCRRKRTRGAYGGRRGRGRPKRPTKATLRAKEAWKGTIRKKKDVKENLQEQQEAFDMFLDFVNSATVLTILSLGFFLLSYMRYLGR
jgi:hypothetical protein